MSRTLRLLVLAVLAAVAAPAAAHAAWFPADAIDGPSPDIVSVDDLDLARDGTGGVVWRRTVDGVPHVFLSRLSGGAWQPPERVDAAVPAAAQEVSVAAADGGRLAVFWVSWSRVYAAFAPAGAGPQPLQGPTLLHESSDGAAAGGLDAEMGINGTAFGVWRTSGAGGADLRAARLKGTTWSLLPAALDIAAGNAAGIGSGRPRVAVDAAGTGLVTWGEAGKVFARRLLGLVPSAYPQEVSLPELSGPADLPEIDVEEDGSFAWVTFRQLDPGGPRAVARRLVGLTFDPGAIIDAGPGAGPPAISISGRGQGTALVQLGGAAFGVDVSFGNRFGAPVRLDGVGGIGPSDVAVSTSDRVDTVVAWRREPGELVARYRPPAGQWEGEVLLSRPELGPVAAGSVRIGGSRNGDTAVAALQGAAGERRVVVAAYDHPPGRAFPQRGWVREAQPLLRWTGGADLWALQGFQVVLDGVPVGGTTGATSFQAPAPLPDGKHTLQIITVDRRGQVVPSGVRTFSIDTVPPTADLVVSGRRRRGRKLQVRVETADAGSGVAAVTVDYGDRSRRGQEAETVHRWKKRGRYRVTARVTDVAGNVTTTAVAVRIRR